jgi:hypothetical protein
MERRVLSVHWPEGFGLLPRGHDYATVAAEALRLSVWRVGCVALGCRVSSAEVRMVIQCDDRHEPQALIDWVRAAAAFAISCYTGYAPEWDAPYQYEWVTTECAGIHIMQCMADPHSPTAERYSADTTVL